MMLANTLVKLDDEKKDFKLNNDDIISLFLDNNEKLFGIHNICRVGKEIMKKEPGDWYGVNSIA